MSFEDNRENVESVYEKMIEHLPAELLEDRYYQYFYNLLETGNNYVDFFSTRLVKEVDEEWVKAIEEALPALQTVVVLAFTAVWNTSSAGVVFDEGLKLLPTALSQISAGGIARTGITAAATLLLLIPPILVFTLQQSQMLQTMSHSGIKD